LNRKQLSKAYDLYGDSLYGFVFWLVRNREACEDIMQTLFLRYWKLESPFATEGENKAWLYRVARNLCMDHFRKSQRFTRFRVHYAQETPLSCTNGAEEKMMWEMLGTLDEQDRMILYLHFKKGLPYKEIGDDLTMTENNVRIRAFRAIKRLRNQFAEELV